MPDRNSRRDELKSRFGGREESETAESSEPSEEAETEKTEETTEMSQTSGTAKTAKSNVKERSNVNMYLPDDLVNELSITFDELNAQHKREHGEPLEKNRDFYPAIVKAGLEGKDVKDVLDI